MIISLSKILLCTVAALIAFAANSVIGRLALASGAIDAVSFTAIRLVSAGAFLIVLVFILRTRKDKGAQVSAGTRSRAGGWLAAVALFVYAISFSFAYGHVDAGTGALVLFGAVQITLFGLNIYTGNNVLLWEWVGAGISFCGLIILMYPQVSTPAVQGFILMALSGVAWGAYTFLGSSSQQPIVDTALNFGRAVLFAGAVWLVMYKQWHLSAGGIGLAVLSGVVASGIGYAIWYSVLPSLSKPVAAVSQLTVPLLAALGGALFISEPLTMRLFIAILFVTAGVLMVTFSKKIPKFNR